MSRFVSSSEVRTYMGLSETLLPDADLDEIITDIEYQVEKYLNCDLTPHVEFEVQDGNGKPNTFTKRAPLLSLRALEINDTTIDVSNLDFKKSGMITLLNDSSTSNLATFTTLKKKVFLKYVHGRVEWDKLTETTTSADASVGTSVALTVASVSGFQVGDWVEIKSFDGNIETSKITVIGVGSITVDEIVFDHLSGATVRLMKISPNIKRFIKLWSSISAITRAVGQSFDEITGYTMGEFQVQKGEPFTQFRETIVRLEQQAEILMKSIRPTPGIVI